MAYKVEKIDPLDLQPRKAIGVSLPFSARGVFNSTYQSKDAIKSNLINFLLTGNQERFLNPNFGAGLTLTSDSANRAVQLLFDGTNWQVVAGEITGTAEMVIA